MNNNCSLKVPFWKILLYTNYWKIEIGSPSPVIENRSKKQLFHNIEEELFYSTSKN